MHAVLARSPNLAWGSPCRHAVLQNIVSDKAYWVGVQVWWRGGGVGHLSAPGPAQASGLPGEALPGVHTRWPPCSARLFQTRHPLTGVLLSFLSQQQAPCALEG